MQGLLQDPTILRGKISSLSAAMEPLSWDPGVDRRPHHALPQLTQVRGLEPSLVASPLWSWWTLQFWTRKLFHCGPHNSGIWISCLLLLQMQIIPLHHSKTSRRLVCIWSSRNETILHFCESALKILQWSKYTQESEKSSPVPGAAWRP